MHKAVILLTKAPDAEAALDNVNEFMMPYGEGDVWDWFVVGGRWSGTLNKANAAFEEKANEFLNALPENASMPGMITQNSVDNNKDRLQEIWLECGGVGLNPMNRGRYHKSDDNIMPLSECIEVVKSWHQNSIEEGFKELEEAKERWLNEENGPNYSMYGYSLRCAANHFEQDFSFDCNVYNIETSNYSLPENLNGWYAVMVDMHN